MRDCEKCIHHISGSCDSWDCKMQTLKEYKAEVIDRFAERLKSKVEEKISLQMFLDEDDLLDKDQVNKYIDEIAEELKAGE